MAKQKPKLEEAELRERKEIVETLHPLVKEWFFNKFDELSEAQLYGVMPIYERKNILVSAPTGGTKCLTPDETVLINEKGKAKLIEGKKLIEKGEEGKLIKKIDKTGKLKKSEGLKSYSLKDGKISKANSFIYYEETDDELLKIKTEYGKEVKISKNHPLLVEGKGWVKARNLERGQKIATPKKIELPEKEIELNWAEALEKLKEEARITITYRDYERLKKKTNNFRKISILNSKELKEVMAMLQLTYKELGEKIGIGLTTVYRLIEGRTNYKKEKVERLLSKKLKHLGFEKNRVIYKTYGAHNFSFKYPKKLNRDLSEWVGFLLAEGIIGDYEKGTHIAISQKNRELLLREFFRISKKYFDVEFQQKNEKDYTIYSTLFSEFITDLFSIEKGRGREVSFPNWLLNCRKSEKKGFMYAFFSLKAHLNKSGISISQSNKNKIEVLNYLLLSFGIFSSISKRKSYAKNTEKKIEREYYRIVIRQIRNLKKFLEEIGIKHDRKVEMKRYIEGNPSGNYVNKYSFDYKKIRNLSKYYENDKKFSEDLGNIYEVVRRTGHISEEALIKLSKKMREKCPQDSLYREVKEKLNQDILWLEIKEIEKFDYEGKVFDLTVPDIHNFVGGYGGIILHNTLTAFLSILNYLITLADKGELEDKTYAVYTSPLKALSNDVHVNLTEPLEEIKNLAKERGVELQEIRVGLRTGDTPSYERQKMLKNPPHILVTTPETLAIVINSKKFVEHLKAVEFLIVDEIHALDNKRGAHLSLTLERLQEMSKIYPARIGLSATVAPLKEVAKFLTGNRDCIIADIKFAKKLDVKVTVPVGSLTETSGSELHTSLYEEVDNLIQDHKTTLVFTNTRAATERVIHHLKERFPKNYMENIGAHHSSLSKEHRFNIEERLRKGELKVVVSSTSLELGIDIGYLDLVILLGSPKSTARALQRIGRAGHKLHETAKGRFIILDRDDLVECSVMKKEMVEKKIDRIQIPTNCLDVLSQQIYGMAINKKWKIEDMFRVIKRSYCYSKLSYDDFLSVISYLRGDYALEDKHIYAKIWYDEEKGMIGKRGKLARVIYMTNIGTIPDESFATVYARGSKEKVGVIDEGFLEKLKKGDIFTLGGSKYEYLYSRGMKVYVNPSVDRPPTIPSWFSEMLPLSFDLALEISRFRRLVGERLELGKSKKEILKFIQDFCYVSKDTAEKLYDYMKLQHDYTGLPSDRKLIIENYKSDKNYWIFHTLFGRKVNDALSRAVAYMLGRAGGRDVEVGITDNGFYVVGEKVNKERIQKVLDFLKEEGLEKVLKAAIDKTQLLKRRFRHCAARSLMILRQYKGRKKSAGKQQMRSHFILGAVKKISHEFPILKEAKREILEDVMDIKNANKVIDWIKKGEAEVEFKKNKLPSPFSLGLIMQGRYDLIKMENKIEFLKRMHKEIKKQVGK